MRSCGQRLREFGEQTRLRSFLSLRWPWKVLWILVFFALLALLCALILGIVMDCWNARVSWERIDLGSEKFKRPATKFSVHLFNNNQVRKSFISELKIEHGSKEHTLLIDEFLVGHGKDLREDELSDLMHMKLKLIEKDLMANYSFREVMTHPCQDMVLSPHLQEEEEILITYSETEIGCQVELDLEQPQGRLIVADAEMFDQDSVSMDLLDSPGFQVIITMAQDCPSGKVHRPISIPVGKVTTVDFVQETAEADPGVLARLSASQRECMEPEDYALEFIPATDEFTTSHCLYNDILTRVLDQCHCIPKFVEFAILNSSQNYCHGRSLLCANTLIRASTLVDAKACLPNCHEVRLHPIANQMEFPSQALFSQSWIFCAAIVKLARICLGAERRIELEAIYPDLCSKIRIANNSGQICVETPNPDLVDASALGNLQEEIFDYARHNLALLKLEAQMPHHLKQSQWVRTEIKPVGRCVFDILLIALVLFGVSLFGMIEFLLHFCSTMCFCSARRSPSPRNSQAPSHATSPTDAHSLESLEAEQAIED